MNSKAPDEMFSVDIDSAIEMLKAKSECLSKKWEYHYDKKCDEKCDECDLMYAQGNCGQIENMYENVIEWLEDYKKIKEKIAFVSSKPIEELSAEYYNKALDDFAEALLKQQVADKSVVKRIREQIGR